MSAEIKRTGPPSARDVKGRLVTWTVPLNAMPDKEWREFFLQTKDTTVTCTPNPSPVVSETFSMSCICVPS